MTQDPEQEPTAGGGSSDRPFEPVPVEPGPTARPGADWEVLAAGGPERERASRAAALRGLWRRQSVRARAVTAAATVVALGLGGTVAYAATSNGSEEGASPAASGSASPSPDGRGDAHGLGKFFGMRGVHGEATVKDPDTGKWVVRTWQRGTVEKVDGDQVTVKSEDGAEWTWAVGPDTKVHNNGAGGTGTDALKKGAEVYVIGSRSDDGTRTATRVLAGTWKERKDKEGKDKEGRGKEGRGKGGPGDWRGRFPGHGGHGPWDRQAPSPSAGPSGSGAAA